MAFASEDGVSAGQNGDTNESDKKPVDLVDNPDSPA